MAILSADAQLSKRYTNHSIRSTVMGLLGEAYEGRIVIGLSGHKSEQTVKQYIRRLPDKTKREMSNFLGENIQAKKAKPNSQPKFQFKKPAAATISKPSEDNPSKAEIAPIPIEQNPTSDQENIQFELQALDDAPPDDVLLSFLNQFDPITENPPPEMPKIPFASNSNTMNISNVNNVQNMQENQAKMPNMFFGGHSTVTINYNFAPPK